MLVVGEFIAYTSDISFFKLFLSEKLANLFSEEFHFVLEWLHSNHKIQEVNKNNLYIFILYSQWLIYL